MLNTRTIFSDSKPITLPHRVTDGPGRSNAARARHRSIHSRALVDIALCLNPPETDGLVSTIIEQTFFSGIRPRFMALQRPAGNYPLLSGFTARPTRGWMQLPMPCLAPHFELQMARFPPGLLVCMWDFDRSTSITSQIVAPRGGLYAIWMEALSMYDVAFVELFSDIKSPISWLSIKTHAHKVWPGLYALLKMCTNCASWSTDGIHWGWKINGKFQ